MAAKVTSTRVELTVVVRDEETLDDINEKWARTLADTHVKEFFPGDDWTYDNTEYISYKMLAFHYRL